MSIVVAVILAVTFLFIWLIVVQLRHGTLDEQVSVAHARDALTEFAERTLFGLHLFLDSTQGKVDGLKRHGQFLMRTC